MSEFRREIDEAVAFLSERCTLRPEVGLILGTGLGGLAGRIDAECEIPYGEIPHFASSAVQSHSGCFVFGKLGGRPIVAMQGRVHYYEGHSMRRITLPVRVMRALGAHTLIASNAVGGMNPQLSPGDLTVVTDHINLMGDNPLIGPNDDTLGPRFPDMSDPYTSELVKTAETAALELGLPLKRAVYVAVAGPNLETAAEYRFLRTIGADTVGMSLVPEVLAAVHGGMRVMAVSVVTDACFPDTLKPANVEEIIRVAGAAEPDLCRLVETVLQRLPEAGKAGDD